MTAEFLRNALRVMPRKITLLLISCVCLIAGHSIGMWSNLADIQDATARTTGNWRVIDEVGGLHAAIANAESSQRGFLLTGDASYLATYERSRATLPAYLARLDKMLAGDAAQLARVRRLEDLVAEKFREMRHTVEIAEQRHTAQGLDHVRGDAGRRTADDVGQLLNAIEGDARQGLAARNERTYQRLRLATSLSFVIGAITLVVLLSFYTYIVRNVLRLRDAQAQLHAANDTLEQQVGVRTMQLSRLSRHLLQIAESEKAALASELHDELGANLTAINLDVTAVATRLQAVEPALAERLQRSLRVLHDTVDIKRRLIHGLRPSMLDSLGLGATLHMHCEDFARRYGLRCDLDLPDDPDELDPAWAIALFRVVQEALTNVAKYARATRLAVSLRRDDTTLVLRVVDDGVGIAPDALAKPLSHGLLGMRERMAQIGGELVVRPGDAGVGTVVEARVAFAASAFPTRAAE